AGAGVGEHDHGYREDEHGELGPAPAARHGHRARQGHGGGGGASAQRLARRSRDGAHEDPPPSTLAGGAGQSGGMVGMGGFGTTLPFTVLTGSFSQACSLPEPFWQRW